MSKETAKTLTITIVILAVIFFVTGLVGHIIHKLDTPSTVLLILVFVFGSALITWLTIVDDHRTQASLLELRGDLEPLGLHILKQQSDSYDVVDADSDTPGHEPIVEGLSLTELEAFRDGLFTGIDRCQGQEQPSIANICTSAGDTDISDWLARQEELDRETGTHAPNCRCAWCEPQEGRVRE